MDNIFNFRQLPISFKGCQSFYRSGSINRMTLEDIRKLKLNYGINCFINLSPKTVNENHIRILFNKSGMKYESFAIKCIQRNKSNPFKIFTPCEYASQYMQIITKQNRCLRNILKSISQSAHDGVLFGCHAGKDRTGVISYLLESSAGVSWKNILDDYMKTNDALFKQSHFLSHLWKKRAWNSNKYLESIKAKEETLIIFDNWMKEKFGDRKNILKSMFTGETEIEILLSNIENYYGKE